MGNDNSDRDVERRLRELREQALGAFSQVNANINKAVEHITGIKAHPDAVDPKVSVLAWEGDRLEQLAELTAFVRTNTTDVDDRDIILRALAIYRSHIAHALKGGKVVYQAADGSTRTLKVRLR